MGGPSPQPPLSLRPCHCSQLRGSGDAIVSEWASRNLVSLATHEANEATASVKFVASVKSSLPVKSRYFLATNQLFCFRFDIDRVIRQTYTHTCMHTNIHIQRYT